MSSRTPFLYLITTGRNTGLPREIEIWFVEAEGLLYILAEHGYKARWVQNILKNPHVHVRVGERQWEGNARVLDPERDAEQYSKACRLAREKYGWGDGLPVEIRRV